MRIIQGGSPGFAGPTRSPDADSDHQPLLLLAKLLDGFHEKIISMIERLSGVHFHRTFQTVEFHSPPGNKEKIINAGS